MSLRIDSLKEYSIIAKIGEGNFSSVYHVQHLVTQIPYALKVFKRKFQKIEEIEQIEEINIMRRLQDAKNVVKLYEVIYEPKKGRLSLVIDLMDKDVFALMKERRCPFPVNQALLLTYQLLSALKDIHSKNIIHRDVKPENCFINPRKMELKLGDFGSSRDLSLDTPLTEYIATRWYRPPELLLSCGTYGPGIDIWAVGCILYEFLTGFPLFAGKTTIDQINRIHRILGTPPHSVLSKMCPSSKLQTFEFVQYPPQKLSRLLPKVSPDVIDLLSKLLAYLPSDRITADASLSHPAFLENQKASFFKHANVGISSAPGIDFIAVASAIKQEKQLSQRIKDDAVVVKKDVTKRAGTAVALQTPPRVFGIPRSQKKKVVISTPPSTDGDDPA